MFTENVMLEIVGLIGTIFTGVMGYMLHKLDKVEKSNRLINAKIDSGRGEVLTLTARISKKLAHDTKKAPDLLAAEHADEVLAEHKAQMKRIK